MIIRPVDITKAWWDKHRAFYTEQVHYSTGCRGSICVTTFATGEAVVRAAGAGADVRGRFATHGFTIGTASELGEAVTLALPDGTRLTAAEVGTGTHQLLLWDHGTGHVVSVEDRRYYAPWIGGLIPPHLRTVGTVYFAGKDLPPQATMPVRYAKVVKPTMAERVKVRQLRAGALWWCRDVSDNGYEPGDFALRSSDTTIDLWLKDTLRKPLPIEQILRLQHIPELTELERLQFASYGVQYRREAGITPYLIATPRTDT